MTQFNGSSAWLIKDDSNHGNGARRFSYCDKVDVKSPALVALGGALTTSADKAFGYIEHLSRIIQNKNNLNVCAAVYDFGTVDPMLIKANEFRRAGRKITLDMDTNVARRKEQQLAQINEMEPVPGYIEDLYEIIIEPRIIRGNAQATANNLHNLIIYSHCHGAVIVNQFTEMATQQMKSAGFDDKTIQQCMANVVVIQHNPAAPLENAKFTTVNFMSASDDTLNFYDAFSKNVLRTDDLPPTYMGPDYANVFIAGKLNQANGSEHGFSVGYKNNQHDLTENGRAIFKAEQNAINNAINAAKSTDLPPPTAEMLASGNNVDIEQMRINGQKIFAKFSR